VHSALSTLGPVDQVIRTTRAEGGEDVAYAIVGSGPLLVLAAWWISHLEHDWNDPLLGHWHREFGLYRISLKVKDISS